MALRKEVFQSKVLQRLYPGPLKTSELIPSCGVDELAKRPHVNRKRLQKDVLQNLTTTDCPASPVKRIYTALPRPPDYVTNAEKSDTIPLLENAQSAENLAEESVPDSNGESDRDDKSCQQRRRRRRRKMKPTAHKDLEKEEEEEDLINRSGADETQAGEGGHHISKNKKRKLKKKRHKEKLLSQGLMPRAAALEFTYQRSESNNQMKVAHVSDFLRTTMEIYMSDSALMTKKVPQLSETLAELLSGLVSGSRPSSLLQKMHELKVLAQKKDGDRLAKALEDLKDDTLMTAEETAAVVSLFQYWISDILPVQGEEQSDQL
ncbi:uncharacterized protein erich1 [Neosynchiropus ocellatus]